MTYVRVTRDQRGYENTFLLHSPHPGARPRLLYWYRSAPGVRVGRQALDEDAIRSIEAQHPEVDFDWAQLIEEASTVTPEVERRPERRRKPQRPRDTLGERPAAPAMPAEAASPTPADTAPVVVPEAREALAELSDPASEPPELQPNPLLDQLVGREIAERLRDRYDEITQRISEAGRDEATRAAWQARADQLDPDRWATPAEILHGIEHADPLFEQLRREVLSA